MSTADQTYLVHLTASASPRVTIVGDDPMQRPKITIEDTADSASTNFADAAAEFKRNVAALLEDRLVSAEAVTFGGLIEPFVVVTCGAELAEAFKTLPGVGSVVESSRVAICAEF